MNDTKERMFEIVNIVDAATVHANLYNPKWVIVDCRFRLENKNNGRERYLESHIPGAVYAHVDDDLAGPPIPDSGRHPLPDLNGFRATLGAWGIGNDSQVVVYDDMGGAFAARLWWMLRYLQHTAVAVLDGGWQAWIEAGYRTQSGEEQRARTVFTGEPNFEMLATMADVEAIINMGKGEQLIDSRDPKRYRGDFEPIDHRAGHIPGAKNHFYGANLESTQHFRPADELRTAFQELVGETPANEIIVYCGSGVTACQNLLALSIAGIEGARLFVPSWSGWSSNPNRPIETGEGASNE